MLLFLKVETIRNMVRPLVTTNIQPSEHTHIHIPIADMWDCVARLIATVLGASERFCNLTMHLLSPKVLDGSFIPGSTV